MAELLDLMEQVVAEFGAAADEVDAAAAAALRVNRTDLRILGMLQNSSSSSATDIARAVGLSPAATTAAIQRLVAVGYIRRDTSMQDRRRAMVSLTPVARHAIDRLYRPLAQAGRRLLVQYSDLELKLIHDFLVRGTTMQREQALRIRSTLS